MLKKIPLFLIVFCISFCFGLDELILNLPEVNKARSELYSSYYDLKLTFSQFGINVDSFYRYSYNKPSITLNLGPSSIRISRDYTYNYGLQLNWILSTFGLLENQIMSKKIIYDTRLMEYHQTISDTYLKFYELLYDYAKSYNIFDFSKRLVEYSNELLNNTKKLYDVGIISKVEYLRVFSLYQDALTQNNSAYQNYLITLRNIYSFVYVSDNSSSDKLIYFINKYNEYLESDKIISLDFPVKNPQDLRVSQIIYSNIRSLYYQKKSVLAQNNPTLALSSQYIKHTVSGFSRDYDFNIALSLNWKIFDSNLSKNQAAVIENKFLALYEEYKRTISNLENIQKNIKSKYQIDYDLYRSYLYNLEYRKESFKLMKLKYENGLSTYLDYLDSQNALLQTILNIKNYKNEIFLDYIKYSYYNDGDIYIKNIIEKIK